jgi:nucleoid-associated protein YgaU
MTLTTRMEFHMGLFDFVKGIGKKNTAAAEPQAAPANTTPAAAAQPAEPSAQEVANKLLGHVKGLGLPITGLSISYNSTSDLATVRGQVQSQADREKIILAVGNIDHVAKVDDQLTVSSPEPESKFYTVKSGDSLSKISKEFYGDANQYNKIFEANRPLLKDADDIFPGQVLRIPA